MQDRIVEFANVLRRNGLRVSLSENIDAFQAVDRVGLEDPVLFRSALRSALVKRKTDLKTFETLFDAFFLGIGAAINAADLRLMEQLRLTPREFEDLLEQARRLLQAMPGEVSELARALLSGSNAVLERILRDALREGPRRPSNETFRLTPFTWIASRLRTDRVQEDIQRFKAAVKLLGGDPAIDNLLRYADQRFRDFYGMLRELIDQEQGKKGMDPSGRSRLTSLPEKNFSFYTEDDIRRMNEAVTRLARRFKDRLSVRRKKALRGRFDVKRTLRKNLEFGGVPFHIELDRRKKTKPEVVILCDISDSVLNASRFMLQFVYSVQDLYTKVRSFVFVSDIGEVTKLFQKSEIHHAVERALKGEIVDVYSHSNFGNAFVSFYKDYLSAINGKTTVVIIGDGRNNYNRPNEWVLREIQRKARRVIWLNPESRITWGVGDSEMPRYMAYCDVAEECRNIRQLYKVVDLLAP